MEDGQVVDFTIEAMLRKAQRMGIKAEEPPPHYFGVQVPRKVVQAIGLVNGFGEPLAEAYFNEMLTREKRQA